MKLESLNAAKFEDFKQFKIDNPLEITGGLVQKTKCQTITGPHAGDWGDDLRLTGSDNHTGDNSFPMGNRSVRGSSGADIVALATGSPHPIVDTIEVAMGGNIGGYTPFSGSSYIGQLDSNDDRSLISRNNGQYVDKLVIYADSEFVTE